MGAQIRWLQRRLRRTAWLLRHRETRADTLRFITAQTAGAALIHGRGLARAHLLRNRTAR